MGIINNSTTKPFSRILVANRGEISCRIQKTCHHLGIETIAIGSRVDAHAAHIQMANYSVIIGEAEAQESYLNGKAIIQAAIDHQAQAIHPGYGFLSENPEFAMAVREAGLVFIGPSHEAIGVMGSKSAAKQIANSVNVPIIPGYMGNQNLKKEAQKLGYPLLIKPTYGGGGKGMRRVNKETEFDDALSACQRESKAAFGNDEVMLEKYLLEPRHVEVQIIADHYGKCIALSDRDCSLQRRHQKVIEEAPAPDLTNQLRQQLHDSAIQIAKAVAYESVGTVEFLVTKDGKYYFLEMNTRLQVEHPVTELILGLDLVELQIRIAQGEHLKLEQIKQQPRGHAIEARLCAEDGDNNFLPSTGLIIKLDLPNLENVRVDTGVRAGDAITIFYDSMIAKIVAWGESRTDALNLLQSALKQTSVRGLKTNLDFVQDMLFHPHIQKTAADIGFIDRYIEEQLTDKEISDEIFVLAVLWLYHHYTNQDSMTSWKHDGWRLNQPSLFNLQFDNGQAISISNVDEYVEIHLTEKIIRVDEIFISNENIITAQIDNHLFQAKIDQHKNDLRIIQDKTLYRLRKTDYNFNAFHKSSGLSHLISPMPGRVVSVMVALKEPVTLGQPLIILEAMKMEHTIRAPYEGIVDDIMFSVGDFCEEGVELVRLIEK